MTSLLQDPFYWEHVKQEKVYGIGAVPYRVGAMNVANKNDKSRLQKIVSNIRMNLREYVHPVSVPFEEVPGDAVPVPTKSANG
jgi:hypothetical protein